MLFSQCFLLQLATWVRCRPRQDVPGQAPPQVTHRTRTPRSLGVYYPEFVLTARFYFPRPNLTTQNPVKEGSGSEDLELLRHHGTLGWLHVQWTLVGAAAVDALRREKRRLASDLQVLVVEAHLLDSRTTRLFLEATTTFLIIFFLISKVSADQQVKSRAPDRWLNSI